MECKVILEDTRNQIGKHKLLNAYLEKAGYTVIRTKLYVGDYTFPNNQSRCVDTKKDVLELIQDVHKDHERFKAECIRAQEADIQLLILIEEALPQGKLANWKSPTYHRKTDKHYPGEPVSKTKPEVLRKLLLTMQERYGVQFRFCHKRDAGQIIINFLENGVIP